MQKQFQTTYSGLRRKVLKNIINDMNRELFFWVNHCSCIDLAHELLNNTAQRLELWFHLIPKPN